MSAYFRKFDVKHGISVNGLPFVDENRNVTLNNLTVQGTSTIIDTRTVSQTDPIISIGNAGKKIFVSGALVGNPGRIFFPAEAFDDIAIGDSIEYDASGFPISPLTNGDIYYVVSKENDVTSDNYRSITISETQGGPEIEFTSSGGGGFERFTLNPLRDLDQDLGIEFNYVDNDGHKKGFFGYQDSTGHFTFLLDTTYGGWSTQSDDGVAPTLPVFDGKKSGVEVKYIKLEPTDALETSIPGIDLDQTWDEGLYSNDVIFNAIDVSIIDTKSNANSTYLEFTYSDGNDTATNFTVRKDGALSLGTQDSATDAAFNGFLSVDGRNNADLVLVDLQDTWNLLPSAIYTGIDLTITNTTSNRDSKLVNFYSTANRKYELYWDGHSVQEVEFTDPNLDADNDPQTNPSPQTAFLLNLTDTASADNSYLLDLQKADVSVFSVRKDGFVEINGPGEFHDTITIETGDPADDVYKDNTQLQTDHVNIAAGSTAPVVVNSMAADSFATAKLLVQVKQGLNYHSTELMIVHNGYDVYMTEYGTVYTSDIIGTFDASLSNGNVNITFTKTAAAINAGALAQVRTTRLAMVA